MGSYTELKHDTLLYVKQAYAELGGGGFGDCQRSIEPPALPVPRWYVEAPAELIDQLVALTELANSHFVDEQRTTFADALNLYKTIALAQRENAAIDDESFEELRLSYQTLAAVTTPKKYVGLMTSKEERGSLIADVFTSGLYGPLYEATGRPYLMLLLVNDHNGGRVVMWPVFTQYEFIADEVRGTALETDSRLNDQQRQEVYQSEPDLSDLRSPAWSLLHSWGVVYESQ